jgi:DNA invertase Pin-like site-specific DNA recombinase
MAEHEREMISERTQAGMDAARREIALNGFRTSKTGRRFSTFGNPRWWESIAKARAANLPAPPPAQLIEIMREKRLEGCTLRAIAGYLNELGVRTLPSYAAESCGCQVKIARNCVSSIFKLA